MNLKNCVSFLILTLACTSVAYGSIDNLKCDFSLTASQGDVESSRFKMVLGTELNGDDTKIRLNSFNDIVSIPKCQAITFESHTDRGDGRSESVHNTVYLPVAQSFSLSEGTLKITAVSGTPTGGSNTEFGIAFGDSLVYLDKSCSFEGYDQQNGDNFTLSIDAAKSSANSYTGTFTAKNPSFDGNGMVVQYDGTVTCSLN